MEGWEGGVREEGPNRVERVRAFDLVQPPLQPHQHQATLPPPPPRAPQPAAVRHGPAAGLAAWARRGDLADLVRDDRAVLFLCELQLPRRLLHARPRRLPERNVRSMTRIRNRDQKPISTG